MVFMTIKKLFYLILVLTSSMWVATNALTVPTNITYYLPITLSNSQGNAIAANTPISLTVNALQYKQYYLPELQNAKLFFSNGTTINSWLEGNASNEIQSSNLYMSNNIIYWLNYGWPSTFLPANTGTATTNSIYLGWAGNVLTAANTLINGLSTGESPFLSSSWGEYDNGKNIFSYYTNFAGNSLPASWYSSGNVIVDNGLTITGGSNSSTRAGIGGQYMGLPSNPLLPPVAVDFYGGIEVLSDSITAYPYIGIVNNSYSVIFQSNIQSSPQSVFQVYNGISGGALVYQYSSNSPDYFNSPSLMSIELNKSGTNFLAKGIINYTKTTTDLTGNNLIFAPNALYSDFEGYIGSANTVIEKMDWVRVRQMPPNGVMPSASFGSIVKPFTVTISAPSNASLDVGQLACFTADVSGSASPFTYNFMITRAADHTANEAQNSYADVASNSQTNCNEVQNYMVGISPLIENVTITNSTQITRGSPYSSEFNVYNAPTVTITPINTTIDVGQYATFEANIPANEGVGPFTVNLIAVGNTLNTKTIPIGGGNVILAYKTTATTPDTFNVIAVDDGTSSPFMFNSISNTIIVNNDPVLSLASSANSINVGGAILISNSIRSGTQPYSALSLSTNAPAGGYAISGNSITFNSIGTFSITGSITDAVNAIASNTVSLTVNGIISGSTGNIIVVLSANTPANVVYQNANTVLTLIPHNNVNAGLFLNNVTSTIASMPSLSGFSLSKIAILNFTVTSGANSISSENVTIGYPCSIGNNVLPYLFTGGTWNAINPFTVNSVSCSIAFSIPVDPVFGIFQKTALPAPTAGGGSPHIIYNVTVSDNVNATKSNESVFDAYIGNVTYSYNQDQLPAHISHQYSQPIQISFTCGFTAGSYVYSYTGTVIGLGSGYPCNSSISIYSGGNYSIIYSSKALKQPNTTTTSSSTTSIITTTILTTVLPTTIPAVAHTTTSLQTNVSQQSSTSYLIITAAILFIIIVLLLLIKSKAKRKR